jgi:hypothetical protein
MFDWMQALPNVETEDELPCFSIGPHEIHFSVSSTGMPPSEALWIGEVVAVRPDADEASDELFWIGKVINIASTSIAVQWYGLNNQQQYTLLPVMPKQPRVPFQAIIYFNVSFTENMKLSKQIQQKIKKNL